MKKVLKGLGYVLGVLIVLRIGLAFVWPTINDVSTGQTPEYPDLQQQVFQKPIDEVFNAALAVAKATGWQVTRTDLETGRIDAVATTKLWKFKDDVTVSFGSQGNTVTVNLRSHSRIGKGDLGANARRIRQFQSDLAAKLGVAPAVTGG